MKFAHKLFKLFAAQPAPRFTAVAPAPLLLALEPRIVYEASVVPVAHAAASHHHADHFSEAHSNAVPGEGVTPGSNARADQGHHTGDKDKTNRALATTLLPGAQPEKQVVFIDPNVTDYQTLIAGLPSGTAYVVLNPNTDGLEQIAQYLQQHPGIDAVHLVSHGSDAQIEVGSTLLDTADLGQYSAELAQIGAAMKPGGDLLIYGCDVAENADGQALVQQIASLSGLNVAAATTPIGAASLGGDWTLNYDVGNVTTPVIFSAAAERNYDALLGQTTENFTSAAAESLNTGDVTSFSLDGITYTFNVANSNIVASDPNFAGISGESSPYNSLVVNNDSVANFTSVTITMQDGKAFSLSSIALDITLFNPGDTAYIQANGSATGEVALAYDAANGGETVVNEALSSSTFGDVTSVKLVFPNDGPALNIGNIVYTELSPPVVTTSGTTTTHEVGAPATVIDSGVTLSDSGSATQASGTVSISSGFQTGDTLSFTNTSSTTYGNISASFSGSVLTLSSSGASATNAQWQAALDAITFTSTSSTTGNRIISFSTNDGTLSSAVESDIVNVTAPPVVTTTGGATGYEVGASATAADSGATLSDGSHSTEASATVTISSGAASGDTLAFTNTSATLYGNISASFSGDVLTLTSNGASATTAQWTHALDAVDFSTTSSTTGDRTISFAVNDGTVTSAVATKTVDVTAPPVVTTSGGITSYETGASATAVDTGVALSDGSHSTEASATATISSGDASGDLLSFTNTSATLYGNISASFSGSVLTLTSSGASATTAQWTNALEAVTFSTSSTTTGNRTISFVVNDGSVNSATATKTVDVTNPVSVTTDSGSAAFVAGDNVTSTPVTVDPGLTVTDTITSTMATATVAITGNFHASEDTLGFSNTGSITGSYDGTTGVLTLTSASATLAQWQAALDSVTYSDTAVTPNNATRTISFTVTDADNNTSNTATRTVTVTDVDQTPIVTTTGGTTNYVGGASATTIDSGVTLSDRDNTTQAFGTVSIASGFHSGDTLSFTNTSSTLYGNIIASFNSGTGVLTLNSSGATATDAQWANAFDAVTFSAGSSATPGDRTVSFVVNDGTENSAAATRTVDVLGPPTVTTDSGSAAFVAGDNVASTPVTIDSGLTVTDGSASTLATATVAISGNFHSGEDVLGFTNNGSTMGNISGSYNAATGVLSLTSAGSSATLAQWQAALDAVTYTDTAVTPNSATRMISFSVTDTASNTSNTAPRTVTVVDTDQTPIVTTTGGTTNYVGGTSATAIDSGVTVSDLDNTTQAFGTVSIASGFHSGDTLTFTNTSSTLFGNITESYNSATGVMTLTSAGATATDAQWANALEAVTFSAGSSATPGNRTVSFVVNDGTDNSAAATKTVDVLGPPTVTTDSGSAAFVAGDNVSSTPVTADSGLSVTDGSASTLATATVAITGNFHSGEDVLGFANTGSITGSYDATTGVLTLTSASATLAQWQAALDSVTYTDTAVTPNNATRTISFTVTDANSDISNTATRTVTVVDTDQTPIVTTTGGTTTYVGGTSATAIDGGVTLSDRDNTTQASGTVSIASGFHSGDTLSFTNTSSTLYGNIIASFNAGTGVLTLNSSGATATDTQWANAFDAVTFSAGSSATPGDRTVSFVVNDGTENSAAATRTVDVLGPPSVTTDSGSAAFTAGDNVASTPVTIDSGLSVTDGSASTLATATVAITGNFHSGEDVLGFANNGSTMGNITGSYNAATGVLSLTSAGSSATLAQWQAALDAVTYTDTAVTPNNATRTISFTVTDANSNASNTATRTVTVADTDQTPIVTTTTGMTTFSSGDNTTSTPVVIDSGIDVSDRGNATLASATVAITSGFQNGYDELTFNADAATMGNITGTYTAATGVLSLSSAGSSATLAQWQAALDSILYTNTAITPSTATRTISFTVSDGIESSAPVTKDINVSATDQTPVATGGGTTVTYTDQSSGGAPVPLDPGVTLSDRGNAALTSATVSVSNGFVQGEDVLSFTGSAATGSITGSFNASTGVLTLSSNGSAATLAQWQAALESVSFSESGPGVSGPRTLSFTVSDGIKTSSPITTTVDVVVATAPSTDRPAAVLLPTSEGSPGPLLAEPMGNPVSSSLIVLDALDRAPPIGAIPGPLTFTFTDPNAPPAHFPVDYTSVSAVSPASVFDSSVADSLMFEQIPVVVDFDAAPDRLFSLDLSNVLPTADGLSLNASSDVSLQLADGRPLPAWLHYDASTGTLSGIMPARVHDVRIVVLQRNAAGNLMRNEIVLAPSGQHARHAHAHAVQHNAQHAAHNALTHLVERATPQAPLPAGKPSLAQQFAQARAVLHVMRPAATTAAAVPEHRA
ncbi:DUF4347 domain-containing protein [Paraburkholderia phenazinium]|uniref:DUF4347 domain-containing protein n=1 Tax=Paraburkholderia phenazinium TaxID=60549 RepID=A0A1G7U7C9_9BURK|nr:DUF4347 domain-containing protein [Paraburkholderia phenazinium]SDG43307.1 protein of unknown function [Paraburkholderia phenazinium]